MKEKIFDLIKENFKNPILYVVIILLSIVILFLFPYIDANFFYYNRVNNRIDILSKMTELDMEKIEGNQILDKEYNNILLEISVQPQSTISQVISIDTRKTVRIIKFITGGFLLWIIAFAYLFMKQISKKGIRILGFFLFIIMGLACGFVAANLPTVFTPWVNYVGFPILLIAIFALLATSGGKNNKNKHI